VKILVTGAGGFLGARVVERLLAHGQKDIRCFLRDAGKAEKLRAIAQAYPDARVEYMSGNLKAEADCLRAVEGVSTLFHLAAGMKGAAAELFADTVVVTRNLLEALEERSEKPEGPVRVVAISSFGVYGVVGLGRGALVNEETRLEPHPELRDPYSYSKLRQEQLLWEMQKKDGFELVVLRPGVIYGPGGGHFSTRVGLQIGPVFFNFGGSNLLPLSYVVNCAEAIVVAGLHADAAGQVYNVHDDELPSASKYLREYKRQAKRIRSLRVPYFALRLGARMLAAYHRRSLGQLPDILSLYKVEAAWGGNRFSNAKLRSLGWKQLVSTKDGLAESFAYFRQQKKP
jgi:nucleoside-diphosphate-sugar epimerase